MHLRDSCQDTGSMSSWDVFENRAVIWMSLSKSFQRVIGEFNSSEEGMMKQAEEVGSSGMLWSSNKTPSI